MSKSLGDILAKKNMAEPPEVQAAKAFIRDLFQADCSITVRSNDYVVAVTGAALAGSLRLHVHELQAAMGTSKRIVIRIN